MHASAAAPSRLARIVAPIALVLVLLGCATPSAAPSGTPTPTPSSSIGGPSTSITPTASSPAGEVPFDPTADLVTTFDSQVFRPAFRVNLPADWVAVERDAAAFQIYFGAEDYEITIDHTYQQDETAEAAMARLLTAQSLTVAGNPQPITIGGQTGLTVIVDAAAPVLWSDSGFHTNAPELRIRLATVPVEGGETVSIFIVANTGADGFAAVDEMALRILSTLEWVAPS